ncbi:MAG TPA: DUF3098 domain-containing protein [Flavobacteriales bacterium]|jgi:hypothetical protein|nr:DUF3098 domain-containing protein [Flavobacteriales bacterium]
MTMSNQDNQSADQLAFTRLNYILLIVGAVLILVGFLLMSGGGSDDPNVFSDAIFSTRRLTVSPIIIVLGYLTVLYSIMKKTGE